MKGGIAKYHAHQHHCVLPISTSAEKTCLGMTISSRNMQHGSLVAKLIFVLTERVVLFMRFLSGFELSPVERKTAFPVVNDHGKSFGVLLPQITHLTIASTLPLCSFHFTLCEGFCFHTNVCGVVEGKLPATRALVFTFRTLTEMDIWR